MIKPLVINLTRGFLLLLKYYLLFCLYSSLSKNLRNINFLLNKMKKLIHKSNKLKLTKLLQKQNQHKKKLIKRTGFVLSVEAQFQMMQ